MYKNMLLEERMARVELEQRIEAGGGTTVFSPSAAAVESATGAGSAVGASSRLMGGIRRMQRNNSWGKVGKGASPAGRADGQGGAPNPGTFLKGVAGNVAAIANDLADAALGTDPAVAAAANAEARASAAAGKPPLPATPPRATPDTDGSSSSRRGSLS